MWYTVNFRSEEILKSPTHIEGIGIVLTTAENTTMYHLFGRLG